MREKDGRVTDYRIVWEVRQDPMVYDKTLEGKTVYLCSACIEDAEFTYNIRQIKEKTKYVHPVTGGLEAQKQWLQRQMEKPGDYFFVVFDKKTGEKIGTLSVYNMEGDEGETGRSIMIGSQLQTIETIVLFYDFVFDVLKLKRVNVEIIDGNMAAIGSVLRTGGREVQRGFNQDLGKEDIFYIITKEAYKEKRMKLESLISRFAAREA